MTILFVCTGNSCRSPMGEAILRNELRRHGLSEIRVSSAGVAADEGYPAHPLAVGVCLNHGIKLNNHRSRRITPELMQESDLLLCMTESQVRLLREVYPSEASRIHLLKLYGRNELISDTDIADPFGVSPSDHETCFQELQREVERILPILCREIRKEKTN
ncbi:MAG: low molecular weight protein arginine phosphatase [Calditrichaeota bacterium]|nr:low molecular weight protein arginine phosphatase [Calditrichota bacterium]